jgi:hypothetical protein
MEIKGLGNLPVRTRAELARDRSIYDSHVAALTARFAPLLADALDALEPRKLISEEWIGAAYDALLLELPPEDRACAELIEAREQAIHSLGNWVDQKADLPPDAREELLAQANQLAQVITSNWITLIKRAYGSRAASGPALELTRDWVPSSFQKPDAFLSAGVEGFEVDSTAVLGALRSYLDATVKGKGDVPVSASLFVCSENGVLTVRHDSERPQETQVDKAVAAVTGPTPLPTETNPRVREQLERETEKHAAVIAASGDRAAVASVHASRMPDIDMQLARDYASYLFDDCLSAVRFGRNAAAMGLSSKYHGIREAMRAELSKFGLELDQVERIAKLATIYSTARSGGMYEPSLSYACSTLESFR